MLAYPQEEPDFGVALSTSLVLFGFDGSNLQILLARSNRPPYKGALFLPSRYLNTEDELMLIHELVKICWSHATLSLPHLNRS